jgi:DNA invertase Pin-like site-specific DNA recombinase
VSNQTGNKGLRAVSYSRVSTIEQVQKGTSLATQADECSSFIRRQRWLLVAEYVDEGISGATGSRPALNALLRASRSGAVDVVVVTKIDRLARSMTHLSAIVATLDDVAVRLATVDGRLDTTTSQGRLMRNILGSFAEFERDLIVERTTAGLRKVAEEGYWPGGPAPFGWRAHRDEEGRTKLHVVKAEAAILREIVRLIVGERLTTREVAAELNRRCIKPPRAERWHYSMLYHLLDRSPLSGTWSYGRSQQRRDCDHQPVVVAVPAIITPGEHKRLRLNLSLGRTSPRRSYREHFYMLGRRLYGPCGGRFHGVYRKDRDVRQYRCSNSLPEALHRCACHRIPAEPVEAMAWKALVAITDAEQLARHAGRDTRSPEQKVGSRGLTQRLDERLARVEAAMVTTTTTYAKAGLPPRVLAAALSSLEDERFVVLNQLDQLVEARNHRVSSTMLNALNDVATAMRHIHAGVHEPEVKARVLSSFDTKIQVLRWRSCATCRGGGKVRGGRGGIRCHVCWGARWIAEIEIQLAIAPFSVLNDLRHELDPGMARVPSDALGEFDAESIFLTARATCDGSVGRQRRSIPHEKHHAHDLDIDAPGAAE